MQFNEFYKKYFKYLTPTVSVIFWLSLIFAFQGVREGIMTVLAAAVHEFGHFLCSLAILKSPTAPYGVLSGFRMKRGRMLSYGEELALYISGPAANLLLSLLLSLLPSHTAKEISLISMFTMLSNLLPIEGYDGYGAAMAAAGALGAESAVESALRCISFALTLVMLLISLYLMYYLNGGYWIYAIFSLSALSFIKKRLNS